MRRECGCRTKAELDALFQRGEIFDEMEIVGLPDDVTPEEVLGSGGGAKGVSAHYACVAWAEGVAPAGGDENKLTGVDVALGRALRETCAGCGKLGATVGCRWPGCGRRFHWPCVHSYGGFVAVKSVLFLCPDHADKSPLSPSPDSTPPPHVWAYAGTRSWCRVRRGARAA